MLSKLTIRHFVFNRHVNKSDREMSLSELCKRSNDHRGQKGNPPGCKLTYLTMGF